MSIIGADGTPGLDGGEPDFTDLNHLLRTRARDQPDALAYCFLENGERPGAALSWGALDRRARETAALLRRRAAPGERVLLLYPSGLDFLVAFFACLYAELIAVPADLPRPGRPMARLLAIVREAQPRLALAPGRAVRERGDLVQALAGAGCLCLSGDEPVAQAPDFEPASPGPRHLALLQYTSGSIGDPKGVMVSHGNLLSTLKDLDHGWGHGPDSKMVTWLPSFHDMGLIYGLLQPLFGGFACYLMSPTAFMQRPMRWLQAISQLRATHTAAPNFAYQLCTEAAKAEQLAALDLRCWKVALNGAEPVQDDVLRRFCEKFAPCGFDPDTFCPGYGLAEAALKVSTKPRGVPTTRIRLDARALERHRVVPAQAGGTVFVGHGNSDIGARIEIVDPASRAPRPQGEVGEIWVASPSVAQGYWRRPRETEATFGARLAGTGEGPFLRTGDLGFVDDGMLYITGRLKDVIIVQGRNHYPQDIEHTVQDCHPALRPDHGAAFSVARDGQEELVVVQEIRRTHLNGLDPKAVIGDIRQAVAEVHDLRAAAVVLLTPGTIAKTTSGKIQRFKCRADYLAGALSALHSTDRPAMTTPALHHRKSETPDVVRAAD